MASTRLAYADPDAPAPTVAALGAAVDPQTAARSRTMAAVPLVITLGAHWIFFIRYWVPETGNVPGQPWALTQLAPLASRLLASAGEAQVPAQTGWWDPPALLLLICSFAVCGLCRTPRFWLGPAGLAFPVVLGSLTAIGMIVALALTDNLGRSLVTVVLLVGWIASAGYATVHKIFDDASGTVDHPREAAVPLIAYAIILTAPIAVGRALFGHPLRDAAVLLHGNTITGRLAALVTPASVLCYACGLLVGVFVTVAWRWRPRMGLRSVSSITLAGVLVLLLALAWPTWSASERRAEELRITTPLEHSRFGCGSMVLDDGAPAPDDPTGARRPPRGLLVTGLGCRNVTAFLGYQQLFTTNVPTKLSGFTAYTPESTPIDGPVVGAAYADVTVLAAGNRMDDAPDRLIGLSAVDGRLLWTYICGSRRSEPLFPRFARVPGGDDPALGHITRGEKKPQIVVNCEGAVVRFGPGGP